AAAVCQAAGRAAEEKRLTLHLGRETTIAFYRRFVMKDGSVRTNPGRNNPMVVRPAGQIDPRVHVLNFTSQRIVAVLFGMHPDCVGGTQYSADYPHHMTQVLRHSLGDAWRVIFLNTCCGNINHININNAKQRSGPDESLRLGSVGLATMPGEMFVELGEEVEKASPFRATRTIALTNGAMGYFPTRRAFAEGGYEAGYRSARYEDDTGHRWARAAGEMLQA